MCACTFRNPWDPATSGTTKENPGRPQLPQAHVESGTEEAGNDGRKHNKENAHFGMFFFLWTGGDAPGFRGILSWFTESWGLYLTAWQVLEGFQVQHQGILKVSMAFRSQAASA